MVNVAVTLADAALMLLTVTPPPLTATAVAPARFDPVNVTSTELPKLPKLGLIPFRTGAPEPCAPAEPQSERRINNVQASFFVKLCLYRLGFFNEPFQPLPESFRPYRKPCAPGCALREPKPNRRNINRLKVAAARAGYEKRGVIFQAPTVFVGMDRICCAR